jgi:hypothetical protein
MTIYEKDSLLANLLFGAEDFRELLTRLCAHPPHQADTIAEVANRLLRERLEKAPVVYGIMNPFEPNRAVCFGVPKRGEDTHKARLVCIEPLRVSSASEEMMTPIEPIESKETKK